MTTTLWYEEEETEVAEKKTLGDRFRRLAHVDRRAPGQVDLGDPAGFTAGHLWDGSRQTPVLLSGRWADPSGDPARSMCLVGEQGAGKTHAAQVIVNGILAAGGQVVVVDPGSTGEYVTLAELTGEYRPGLRCRTVRLGDPALCWDPLRLFAGDEEPSAFMGDERFVRTVGMCAAMLAISTADARGQALARAVHEVIGRGGDARLGDVVDALEAAADGGRTGAAAAAAAQLRAVADTELGRAIFGDGEPLEVADADLVVLAAATGELLPRGTLRLRAVGWNAEAAAAEGLRYLACGVAGRVAYADVDRLCLCVFDPVGPLAASAATAELLNDLLAGARPHRAQLLVAEIGDEKSFLGSGFYEKIGCWFAFRHYSSAAAQRTLRRMGLGDDDLETLASPDMAAGMCLVRDARGRSGAMRFASATLPRPEGDGTGAGRRLVAAEPRFVRLARVGAHAAGRVERWFGAAVEICETVAGLRSGKLVVRPRCTRCAQLPAELSGGGLCAVCGYRLEHGDDAPIPVLPRSPRMP